MKKRRVGGFVLALAAIAACGDGYPSRDWSGNYLTRMVASSSDCRDSPLPPPLTAFTMNVTQLPNNQASVWMNPIITVTGGFEGDRLHADAAFVEELHLPDTLRQRLAPADSFETILYDLEARFEGAGFQARYHVRTPDVRALAAGRRPFRCSYRYELRGARFEPPPLSQEPWTRELAPADTGAAAPGDTAAGAPR